MGAIASVFYRAIAKERVKRHFLISNVSVGNITLSHGQHVTHELQVEQTWYTVCSHKNHPHVICSMILQPHKATNKDEVLCHIKKHEACINK
jgi:hypothetical protein